MKDKKRITDERKFYFSAETEKQLEEWTIYLEFMKSKALYDEFVE
jgi:adenylate cyclase 10